MRIRDLKIGTQLFLAFAIMLMFVAFLSYISYLQNNLLLQQTELIYEHPFNVSESLGKLKANILQMRLSTRDLMLAETVDEQQEIIRKIEIATKDADENFSKLRDKHLGSQDEIMDAQNAFIDWNTTRKENLKLIVQGQVKQARINVRNDGIVGELREKMLSKIDIISANALKQVNNLNNESIRISKELNRNIALISIGLILLTIIIGFYIISNIRIPIKTLTNLMLDFKSGKLMVRSEFKLKNEFGVMFESFFNMVEQIEADKQLSKLTDELSDAMSNESNSHTFFNELLPILLTHTNSQIGAVYLYFNELNSYVLYESVGISPELIKKSFDPACYEGEFGKTLLTKKIECIRNIPSDTKFVFQATSGSMLAREIITIPIVDSKNFVVAIISLSSLNIFSDKIIQYIYKTNNVLTARILGILAYRELRKSSKILLEHQIEVNAKNKELESQKNELTTQSDILKQQNSELEIQKVQLNEVSRLKTNFLSNMSHELRTPLNSVIALSGVLSRRLANTIPPDEYSYLEVIERNGKHLLMLINDILDISRIESGNEDVDIEIINMNDVVEDIVELIKPQTDPDKVKLVFNKPGENIEIQSDIRKLKHILQNLVGNAAKFTYEGKIEIDIQLLVDKIKILVKDTGIGISQQNIQYIFDEFRQADGSTSRRFGGTGLGLSIAKKYANLLGGSITVTSTIDQGSMFTLELPIKFGDKIPERETKVTKTYPIQTNQTSNVKVEDKTILLVEDSDPAIIQIKDFVEQSGYKVIAAKSGQEALNLVSTSKPDGIILDLMMPEMDGFKVLETIREAESTSQIPVLILTAKHITKDELKFLTKNNIYQLIQKGDVNRAELLNSIHSMLKPAPTTSTLVRKIYQSENKPKVLIVEDNVDNMITVKALIAEKFDIIEAHDGLEAVENAMKYLPDLILMDIALPRQDGIAAFKEIRSNAKLANIPIIALTASAMTKDKEIILSHGFDGYLTKPIDNKVFNKTINEIFYGK